MSILATRTKRVSAGLLAFVTTVLVVASGMIAAPAAYAAPVDAPGPTITVSPSSDLDPAAANTLTIQGTGFVGDGAADGVYVLFGEKSVWAGEGALNPNGWIAQGWVRPHMMVDGSFQTTLTAPAGSLDSSKEYQVATSAAHGFAFTDRTLDTFTDVTVAPPAPAVQTTTTLAASPATIVEGEEVTLTATVAPSAVGTVTFTAGETAVGSADTDDTGVAAITVSTLVPGTHAVMATFAPSDSNEFSGSSSALQEVHVTETQAPAPGAELKVSKTDGLDPEGAEITVTGTGYKIYPGGTYAQIGWITEGEWTPISGEDTRASNRAGVKSAWIGSGFPGQPAWETAEDGTGSFTWTVAITQAEMETKRLDGGTLAVFTVGAHGAWVQPENERFVPIKFAEPLVETGSLNWAFMTGWNGYVKGFAQGEITGLNGVTVDEAGNATYPQVVGGDFDPATGIGEIHYQGTVRYESAFHRFDIALKDPRIVFTSSSEASLTAEVSNSDSAGVSDMTRITLATVTPGTFSTNDDGALEWASATGVLADLTHPNGWTRYSGTETAPLSFTYGSAESSIPVGPEEPATPGTPGTPVTPTPTPAPKPVDAAQQAGTLVWGISQGFEDYTTGNIGRGSVLLNGAGISGSAYVFPQAGGGSWNSEAHSGTVNFSGVVTFSAHGGLMTETFANPSITVTSATSGTLSAGGRTFGLNLAAASKTVGANGEVTWSGVPVSGTIEGGGASGAGTGGGSFAPDPLTFTVGSASSVQYGSATLNTPKVDREPAATAPATEGIEVVTPADQLVPGGEIEFTASGFESNERDILVVVYSEPIVLDRKAGANGDGEVRWIGNLPEDLAPGTHTITLQGSKNAGAIIEVSDPSTAEMVTATTLSSGDAPVEASSAGVASEVNAGPVWLWWIGAGALIVLALATAGLVVQQRRAAAAGASAASAGSNSAV